MNTLTTILFFVIGFLGANCYEYWTEPKYDYKINIIADTTYQITGGGRYSNNVDTTTNLNEYILNDNQ